MQNSVFNKHHDCDVVINLNRTNAYGQPALCCATHRDRKGRLCYIDWLSKKEYNYLKYNMGIKEVNDVPPFYTYFDPHECEPDYLEWEQKQAERLKY